MERNINLQSTALHKFWRAKPVVIPLTSRVQSNNVAMFERSKCSQSCFLSLLPGISASSKENLVLSAWILLQL